MDQDKSDLEEFGLADERSAKTADPSSTPLIDGFRQAFREGAQRVLGASHQPHLGVGRCLSWQQLEELARMR